MPQNLELTTAQRTTLFSYKQRLTIHGFGNDDISTSDDGVITVERAEEIFPGCTTAHLWHIGDEFILDIVSPGGIVTSVDVTSPEEISG